MSALQVFVVDTGEQELYVIAREDYEAGEHVAALGERVEYVEHYSDDVGDVPSQYEALIADSGNPFPF